MIGEDLKKILVKIKRRLFSNTYSQAGEDAIIAFLFQDKKMFPVTYLDIGTNLPDEGNNTYLLYKRGNRGVCVEADKSLIKLIQKVRPQDKVLNAGVTVSALDEADFYIFDVKGLNTFDKEEVVKKEASGKYKVSEIVKVPLLNINQIIRENFQTYPDLLSIDIEGLDMEVLKSLDFITYPIRVICVETCTYSENHVRPKDKLIQEFLLTKGYEVYADTYINTIFINQAWFYQL